MTTTSATAQRRGRISTARLAGLAALGFAIGVLIQNAVLMVGAPTADTSIADAASWYAANRGRTAVVSAIVAVNLPLILIFSACMAELGQTTETARRWMRLGALGATSMVAVFALVTGGQIAAVLFAEAGATDAFAAVWSLHNAAFAINLSVLGTAFLGFALGAHACGVTPVWQRNLGAAGAGLLLVGGLANTAVADGSPVVFVGFGGFVLWLVWLTTIGVRLLRRSTT